MSDDRVANLLLYGIMLILPLSALIVRRPKAGPVLKMAAAWVGIFAIGLILVSQRHHVTGLFTDQRVEGSQTRIRMGEDGHFHADVTVNGVTRSMLIDSGATTTALSVNTARAAGLDLEESPFPRMLQTANGPVAAQTATASSVTVGSIDTRDLTVVVSPAFGDQDVLGMNFLSRLGSWSVEKGELVLTPDTAS
ncbi:TIGR02281 family clan AA aspartic protease [uncultured Sphingomonas sp.]|uniref:retropepsin-like aspartic protease family protein n=1 Tax=uncultured Sphingomonas sp. TaxID=158754 RepID=UPI002631569D|nr:TIGR02281 family clan AA aspartic protease [uncultured Sphingomonas sp.]